MEKVEKSLRIDFESKPVYGDDDKYIKNKNKHICGQYDYIYIQIFTIKKCLKKNLHASVCQ